MGHTWFIFRSAEDARKAEDRLRPITETLECVRPLGGRSIAVTDPRHLNLVRRVLNGAVGVGRYTEAVSDRPPFPEDEKENNIINR